MTLTVRSATVSGATTKGSALTHAEMDANWAHVIQSSNQSFVPSGTGAITSTVAAALRLTTHTSQYGTTGNFNTATDALTGTLGVPALRLKTPTLGSVTTFVRIPSPDPLAGDFSIFMDDNNVFSGDRDNVWTWGYNLAGAQVQELASEPGIGFSVENHYNNGSAHLMEFHLQGAHTDGTAWRSWTWTFNRTTKEIRHAIGLDDIRIQDATLTYIPFKISSITASSAAMTIGAAGTTITLSGTVSGAIPFTTTNASDIGSSSVTARTGYFGTSLFCPLFQSGGAADYQFYTNGQAWPAFTISHKASGVNAYSIVGAIAGNQPVLSVTGSDTNITAAYTSKGTGGHDFYTNENFYKQVQILNTASATRTLTLTGSNGGNPTIGTSAGRLNISSALTLSSLGAFAASDKYLIADSSGNVHVSALGPAS